MNTLTHSEQPKQKQRRSKQYIKDRKHVSLIMTTEDYVMLQYLKRRMSKEERQTVSFSEVIRRACKKMAGEPNFITSSEPVRRGNRFED
jgi:hypothetical protein